MFPSSALNFVARKSGMAEEEIVDIVIISDTRPKGNPANLHGVYQSATELQQDSHNVGQRWFTG
jgi:hypothetical protein